MTSSKKLQQLISSNRPEDVDEALNLLAHILISIEPQLVRRVASFNALIDSEEFIANECELALLTVRDQFLGQKPTLPLVAIFDKADLEVVLGWMKARIGKPFAGAQSGRVTNAIRRERKEQNNLCQFDENVHDYSNDEICDKFDLEEAMAILEQKLTKVEKRNAVIFRLSNGLHNIKEFTPKALASFAASHGFNKNEINLLKGIAKSMLKAGQKALPKMDQMTLARLFVIGDRQVRTIVAEVKKTLTISVNNNFHQS